jgi:hypothetical protein
MICSLFLLMESVSGLLMSEPWLIGGKTDRGQIDLNFNAGDLSSSSGNVGGTNPRILVDLTTIGIMILTLTGIIMSVLALRARRKSRKRNCETLHKPGWEGNEDR